MDAVNKEILHQNASGAISKTSPVLIYRGGCKSAADWESGGTALFLNTGNSTFLVTANHVIEEADNLRKLHSIYVFIAGHGREPVDIKDWEVIDRNRCIDICTIRIPDEFNLSELGKETYNANAWPPKRAEAGECVFIIGFPAEHRDGETNAVRNAAASIMDFITSVGPHKFLMADENEVRTTAILDAHKPDIVNFGGMSGSPMFAVSNNGDTRLVGVFIEGGGLVDGTHAPFFGSHIDFVNADGTIDTAKIPFI